VEVEVVEICDPGDNAAAEPWSDQSGSVLPGW